jgi:pimeloyl-ACP methyl ester carboxylesterase
VSETSVDRRALIKMAMSAPIAAAVATSAPSNAQGAAKYVRTFVPHKYTEQQVDLGEITMNYAVAGKADMPALLLIPQQTESWWGYEPLFDLLSANFQCFAVDLRGQGRSSWTPGRYSLDIIGNDLVRFIDLVVKRPVVVAGNSSGGVLAAWLAAFAKPGQLRAALCEDAPLFAIETDPLWGPATRQSIGPVFHVRSLFLGDQWQIGDWNGYQQALAKLPFYGKVYPQQPEPPQNLKEYDPEWGRACWEGTFVGNARTESFLSQAKVPVLLTHHARLIDPETGVFLGALSDQQATKAGELIKAAGAAFTYRSFPKAAHAMHATEPAVYASTMKEWFVNSGL